MAFMKIKIGGRGLQLPPGASARLAFNQKGKAQIAMSFDVKLVTRLHWKKGIVLAPEVGTGEDEGRIRLVPDGHGLKLAECFGGRHFRLALKPWWSFDHMRRIGSATIECTHVVDKNALIVTLPKGWFPQDD